MLKTIDKSALLSHLVATLGQALELVTSAQRSSAQGATHEENRAEGDKDMRATEVSYVARGQAARVVSLREELRRAEAIVGRPFTADTPLAAGALVSLTDSNGRRSHHLLMPAGAGVELCVSPRAIPSSPDEPDAVTISVIGTRSPLGQALLGAFEGDEVSVDDSEGERSWTIAEVG